MKTNDQIETVVATSHRRIARVDLYDGNTPAYENLPISEGTVVGAATEYDRWSARFTVSGDLWVPIDPTDPLSGFSGLHARVFMGAEVDTVDEVLEVCRVVPIETRVQRSVEDVNVEVTCVGPAGWLDTISTTYTTADAATCQALIVKAVTDASPPAWDGTVDDTTSGVSVPADYTSDGSSVWAMVEDMCAVANVTAYFDALGTLVIRNPLPSTAGTPAVTLAVGSNLAEYDQETGRSFGFANDVRLRFTRDDGTERIGVASQGTGPLRFNGPAGRVTYTEDRDGYPSVTQANARAAALLPGLLSAWSTTIVLAVPDPRLEPDDDVTLVLPDRTVTARATRVELPMSAQDLMTVGVRTYPEV